MIKALDLSKTIVFESPRDTAKGTEDATKFIIGAIPSRVYAALKDSATTYRQDPNNQDDIKVDFRPNDIAKDMVRYGLKGIQNFCTASGAVVTFKTTKARVGNSEYDVLADEVLDVIDLDTIREIAQAIREICEVDVNTEKNSVE
jgi:hypothetical protein